MADAGTNPAGSDGAESIAPSIRPVNLSSRSELSLKTRIKLLMVKYNRPGIGAESRGVVGLISPTTPCISGFIMLVLQALQAPVTAAVRRPGMLQGSVPDCTPVCPW